MNRRGFFSRIASAALAGVIVPREKLLIDPAVYALDCGAFAFHRAAFSLTVPGVPLPFGWVQDRETGISIRYTIEGRFAVNPERYEVKRYAVGTGAAVFALKTL